MRLVQESLDAAVPSQPSASNIESASSNTTGQSDAPADSMPSQLPSNEAASPAAQSQESRPANESSAQSGVDSSNGKIIDTSEGQSSNMEQKPEVPPIQLLRDALNHAHKGTRLPGSSTACVLQLNAAASNVNAAVLVRTPLAGCQCIWFSYMSLHAIVSYARLVCPQHGWLLGM